MLMNDYDHSTKRNNIVLLSTVILLVTFGIMLLCLWFGMGHSDFLAALFKGFPVFKYYAGYVIQIVTIYKFFVKYLVL